jgi:hypothetical protein
VGFTITTDGKLPRCDDLHRRAIKLIRVG